MKSTRYERSLLRSLTREQQVARVRKILQTELTDLQRYTLTAYYFENKTLEEIGIHRGVNKSTVCRTLKRAEEKVRRFLRY